ncbi:MAG: hypothetical protein ACYTFT_14895 [Planctomycetota bacterium]|jgi:hypothetical protein
MEMINRAAIVLRPRQPYLEWSKKDDETGVAESAFESMHEDPTVFLLPEYEDPDSEGDVLRKYWPVLFAAMLEGRLRDESMWPQDRTLQMFQDWFEVPMSSVVRDLCLDEPLEHLE